MMKPGRSLSGVRSTSRGGLAPVEFVLCLPLLLMIMAMIIIVGSAGAWKVRTLANSRQAAARAIWPRTGAFDPSPASWWPATAFMSSGTANPDPIEANPFALHTVVCGPEIGVQGFGSLQVNTSLLDMTEGLVAGNSSIDRELPLWKQLPYRNRYHRATQIYTGDDQRGQWQFGPMGLGSNISRRVDDLYPDYNLGAYGGLDRTQAAVDAIRRFPNTNPHDSAKLQVLDNDPELRYRDFYPQFPYACTADLQAMVDAQKERIECVPSVLAQAFLEVYPEGSLEHDQLTEFLSQHGCD